MSDQAVKSTLWWLCLALAPLVLLVIELFHPAGFTVTPGMYEYLSKPEPYQPQFHALAYWGPPWWFTLHMIQTPVVALVGVGLWIMLSDVSDGDSGKARLAAWISRAAIFVFMVYYTVLDSIGGIGLGKTMMTINATMPALSGPQLDTISALLNKMWVDPWVGGVGSVISQTGSWAIFVAAVAAALALLIAKRAPWPPLILLVAFGWELQTSHAAYSGPIAFALLIIASAWIWFARRGA
jgi:hypothetical protein